MSKVLERTTDPSVPLEADQPVELRIRAEIFQSTEDQIRAAMRLVGFVADDADSYAWCFDILFGCPSEELPLAETSLRRVVDRRRRRDNKPSSY